MNNAALRLLAILVLSWLLASCGGGGGGGQLPSADENTPANQQGQQAQQSPVVEQPEAPADDPALPGPPAPQGDWRSTVYDQLPLPDVAFSPYSEAAHQAAAQQILALTNVERVAAGLNPLSGDVHLDRVAQAHGMDMATNDYFAHDNLYGMAPWHRLDVINPPAYVSAGENIAGGQPDAQAVMAGWMDSQGHRENILRDYFTHMGVGVYYDPASPFGVYYVQMFATFPGDPTLHSWYEPGE